MSAVNSFKDWILGRFVDIMFPHIFLWPNPFKIFEYKQLMAGVVLRPDDEVLDLGCGGGLHVFLLAKKCRRAVGLDISDKWIRRAHQEMHRLKAKDKVQFFCGAIEKAGFPEGSFDKVFSFSVLEHIPNYRDVLVECRRVLKPGGSIHFSVDWLGSIQESDLLEKHRKDHGVIRYFGPDEMRSLLEETGFRKIQIGTFIREEYSVALFKQGIRECFVSSYSGAIRDFIRLKRWESRPTEPGSPKAIYLHVRAER